MTPDEVLRATRTVLLIDWPTRDVPEALARAGYEVIASQGPGPEDYTAYDLDDDQVVARHAGAPPARAELVYSHRPDGDLPGVIDLARHVGATAIWCETPSPRARELIEAAGLVYVGARKIVDALNR
jgi:hypothetical protein